MKRHLLIIAVFLLLGAVVNVAVAWGLAARVDVAAAPPVRGLSSSEPPRIHFTLRSRLGASRFTYSFHDKWVATVRGERLVPRPEVIPSWMGSNISNTSGVSRIEDARGWPALAMHCTVWKECEGRAVWGGIRLAMNRNRRTSSLGFRSLPLRPIWPGFALNTVFYAAVLWLLIPGPFVLRRFVRVRRGLCPACAYPIGESSVCTECGNSLPRRRDAHLAKGGEA